MLEIQNAKEIHGSVELPPSPDYFLLCLGLCCAAHKKIRIGPVENTPLVQRYMHVFSSQCDIVCTDKTCTVTPKPDGGASTIPLAYHELAYRDIIVFLLLGLHKTLTFSDLPPKRLDTWHQQAKRFGFSISTRQFDNAIGLSLGAGDQLKLSDDFLDGNDIHACIGLALGLKIQCSFTVDHQFQSPLRNILPAFGYELIVKSNAEKVERGSLASRLRFLAPKLVKKTDSKFSFSIFIDCSKSVIEEPVITIPGDELLGAILFAAKSVVPKGQLVVSNVPLETWSIATLNYIRKMGCNVAMQQAHQSSFGASGMVTLQKFNRLGHKMECKPLYLYATQLPVMVVLATFAQGQSIFRALEDLHNDIPDPIDQILYCIRVLGGRHGEMPDGIVIDGAKQYDGFDLQESFSASLNGGCSVAALRCNGRSTINDTAIAERWPTFKNILDSICAYRS